MRDLLGHASIVTTERYDNQQLERQVAAGKLESGKLFEAPIRESGTEFHISCTTGPSVCASDFASESDTADNSLSNEGVEDWLGVRDEFRNCSNRPSAPET